MEARERLFSEAPPPDELGEPCADCGTKEKWRWLDGRLLCRACLLRETPAMVSPPRHQVRRREPWSWPALQGMVER
jgi:hypothetical protein